MMEKLILISLILFFLNTGSLFAQIEEKSQQSRGLQEERLFSYTSEATARDTFTISVIDPHGNLKTAPIQNQVLSSRAKTDFSIRTRYWKPGIYRIVARGKKGVISTRRFRIKHKN
ncbi:MAG: hypothetical protein KTR24_09150 [Saprospiraceae bacterium]|nr:hypothetical protein [Saprospiraceae bacterium]